jgi:hypothetical protein
MKMSEHLDTIARVLAEMQEGLDSEIKDFRNMHAQVCSLLRSDPALVYLLTEEQIGAIVQAKLVDAKTQLLKPEKVKKVKTASQTLMSMLDTDLSNLNL